MLPKVDDPYGFVSEMFERHQVITYLGEWFGAPDRVRLSYALDADKIEAGLERIGTYLSTR